MRLYDCQLRDPAAVICEGDERPFCCDVGEATETEESEAHGALDDAADWFDGPLAQGVKDFCQILLQSGLHVQAPGLTSKEMTSCHACSHDRTTCFRHGLSGHRLWKCSYHIFISGIGIFLYHYYSMNKLK